MTYAGNTYSYVTDGNKNVTALLDAAGFRVAGYTYGPFGQVLSMDGALAEVNPFRFSSEFHDDETGLVYYNYRYYSPNLGRWTKRDPIGEEGGVNEYLIAGNSLNNQIDHLGLVVLLVHGVNTNAAWFDLAKQGLKDAGCPQEVIYFRWYDDAAFWGYKRKGGGQPNYATDNVKDMNSTTLNRSYMLRAVARLKNILNSLNKVKKKLSSKEPINVIAHSQGTIITIAALQQGAKIDNFIMMGSPLDIWENDNNGTNDLTEAQSSIAGKTFNYWSAGDEWAYFKGGIGARGDELGKKAGMSWIVNREFAPGAKIHGYILPSTGEYDEYDHSDYMGKKDFFEKIHFYDIAPASDNLLSNDPIIDRLKKAANI